MHNRLIRKLLTIGLAAAMVLHTPYYADAASYVTIPVKQQTEDKIVICIDPGHGGDTDGATFTYDEVTVREKDVNLKIALKLQEELLKYENVEVVMTRTEDITMELRPRVQLAADADADYLISIHNNSQGNPNAPEPVRGLMVLSTASRYQAPGAKISDIYGVSEKLSLAIVDKLQNQLGLAFSTELNAQINGVVKRPYSPEGGAKSTTYYPDGSVSDYYALIRYSVEKGLPAIIIEHAYLSHEEEYKNYLMTEESLEALARADSDGIAEALNLTLKQEYIPAAILP